MDEAKVALAEGVMSSLLLGALITHFIEKGILTRDDAINLADSTLYVFEQHRASANSPSPDVIDHARSRLEGLIERFRSMPDRGTGQSV